MGQYSQASRLRYSIVRISSEDTTGPADAGRGSDSSPFPFGILNVCDIDHLHGAIAPRPLLVRANLPDEWWPVSGFGHVETFTRGIYRLYDAEDRIDFRAEVHEHNLTGPFADTLERFLLSYV